MEILLISVAFGAFSSLVTVFISKKINKASLKFFIEQAKAKARVIKHKAEVALKDAQLKAKFECDKVKMLERVWKYVHRKEEKRAEMAFWKWIKTYKAQKKRLSKIIKIAI